MDTDRGSVPSRHERGPRLAEEVTAVSSATDRRDAATVSVPAEQLIRSGTAPPRG